MSEAFDKNNALDHLIALAAQDCGERDLKMFDSIDASDIELSQELDKRVENEIELSKKSAKKAKRKIYIRVLAAVLAAILLAATAAFAISAVTDSSFFGVNWIHGRADHHIINHTPPIDTTEENVQNEPPKRIDKYKYPDIPREYSQLRTFGNRQCCSFFYYDGAECIMEYIQSTFNRNPIYPRKENSVVERTKVNSFDALLITYTNSPQIYLTWNDGEYIYYIISYVMSAEEIISVAKNFK